MVLKLSFMEEKDIPAFAIVDEAAFEGSAFAQAMQAPGQRRRDMAEDFVRQGWNKHDDETWLKVTDTENGDFVAAALWKLHAAKETTTKDDEEAGKATEHPEELQKVAAFFAAKGVMWRRFEAEHIGTKPFLRE